MHTMLLIAIYISLYVRHSCYHVTTDGSYPCYLFHDQWYMIIPCILPGESSSPASESTQWRVPTATFRTAPNLQWPWPPFARPVTVTLLDSQTFSYSTISQHAVDRNHHCNPFLQLILFYIWTTLIFHAFNSIYFTLNLTPHLKA